MKSRNTEHQSTVPSSASRTPAERDALRQAIAALALRAERLGVLDPLDAEPALTFDPGDAR